MKRVERKCKKQPHSELLTHSQQTTESSGSTGTALVSIIIREPDYRDPVWVVGFVVVNQRRSVFAQGVGRVCEGS